MHAIDCVKCHSNWGTYTPRGTDQEAACVQCHNETGDASSKADVGLHNVSKYITETIDCGQCHEIHNSSTYSFVTTDTHSGGVTASNIAFIRWNVTKYQSQAVEPLVFQNRPEHFAFSTSPYNGACETCHTRTSRWTNDGNINGNPGTPADMTHEAGNDCASCHGHAGGFKAAGNNCLSSECHGTPAGEPNTAPDVESEFALTSHHVAGGVATNEDCAVCHEESNDNGVHGDGSVDLIDPDDAATIITINLPITRDRASNAIEADVQALQDFCLGCHDTDGATATYLAGKTARSPFTVADRDAPDVKSQLDPAISDFHHAVTVAGSNPYTTPTTTNGNNITMVPPWNQTSNSHDQITCFDCHDLDGHGTANQRMLRDPIDFDSMEIQTDARNIPAGMGATVETFCSRCHDAAVYVTSNDSEAAGSVFEFHGASQSQHSASGGNELGCMGCHAGIVNFGTIGDNGSLRGNIHGTAFTWPNDSPGSAPNTATDLFMLGGWLNGWFDDTANTQGQCWGGACNHSKAGGKTYTK
jgi:hypothetical protein